MSTGSAKPWLTVITVVKDDTEGLSRTLGSLAHQDMTGVEFLVIDSSREAGAVPAQLKARGIAGVVVWSEPAGIYAAMNLGLARAGGTYVYFLNAGDEFASADVLDGLRGTVEQGSPIWLFGDVEILGTDGSVVVTPPWDFESERQAAFSGGRFPAHQGTVVRTDVLRSIGGFDASYRIAADYAAFLRLTEAAAPVRVNAVVARFYEGGVSTRKWAVSLREFHRARRTILQPSGRTALRELLGTGRQFAAMAAHRSPWPVVAALALLTVLLLGVTGVDWGTATLLTAFVAFQGLGGAIWWRLLRPGRSVPVLEAVGMGLGLGTAMAMLTGLYWTWWLAPVASLAAWVMLVRGRRKPVAPLAPLARTDLLALTVGLVPGTAAFLLAIRNYPLAWSGVWSGYHGDMPFFEALAASVARLGPGASIFMSGADLRYHSLAYGWAGQLTVAVNAEPFVVLTRLLPLVTLLAATALAGAWTRRLTRTWWAPALAVGLVVTGGFVGATFGSVLNFDSPSQSMGAVWLLALSPLFLQALERVSLPWHVLAAAALMGALTGGKISTAAIALGGLALVSLVGLIRRETWRWRALAISAVTLVTFMTTYVLLLAGSANAGGLGLFTLLDRASSVQGLNPVVTPKGIVAGIALLVIAVVPRWAGLAWLASDHDTRWASPTIYGLGLALGGIATIAFLSGGFNDLWFAVAASAPLAVLSAAGVAAAVAWLGPDARRRTLAAFSIGLAASLLVAGIWASGSTGIIGDGWRWAGPLAGLLLAIGAGIALCRLPGRSRTSSLAALTIIALVAMALPARLVYAIAQPLAPGQGGTASPTLFGPQFEYLYGLDEDAGSSWSNTQAAAGTWLRSHAQTDDLVATNVTRGALVPALTRLTTFVSDMHMQAPYGRVTTLPEITRREIQSWAFINGPSEFTLAPLCKAGVTWLWVDPTRTGSRNWKPYALVEWAAPDAIILRVSASACP